MDWLTNLLQILQKFIEDNWSGLAVLLWNYEEQKIDTVEQQQKTEQLKATLVQNENDTLKEFASKPDDDVIDTIVGTVPGPNKPDGKA
jgi:hypothetical protein